MVSKYQITGVLHRDVRNEGNLSRLHKFSPDVHNNAEKLRELGMRQLKQSSTASTSGTKKTDSVQRLDDSTSTAHRLHEEYLNSLRNK